MRKLKITISKEIVITDLIGFMHVLKFILVVLNARHDVKRPINTVISTFEMFNGHNLVVEILK